MKQKFYVDTCIYLNLWQDEKPFSFYAKTFFENHSENIFYSKFVIRELKFILEKDEYNKKRELFNCFKKISLSKKEFSLARKIESKLNYEISFYDIIHLILAKKSNSILVTRDKKLLKFARKYFIFAAKPEEI